MITHPELDCLKRIAEEIFDNHLAGWIPTAMLRTVAKRSISELKSLPGYHNFDAIITEAFPGRTAEDILFEMVEEKLLTEAA